MKKSVKISLAILAVSVISIAGFALFKPKHDQPIFTGWVEMRELDISSKIAGRIAKICVVEGDTVRAGDTIAILESPEIDAKIGQATAASDAAKAKMTMASNGARPEEKRAAEQLYRQAKAQFDLTEKTYQRMSKLVADSVISKQEYEGVTAQREASRAQMEAARAKLDLVDAGARTEEKSAATSLYQQASAVLSETEAYKNSTVILAPQDGEISKLILSAGEIAAAGSPIAVLVDTKDQWVIVQLKETDLNSFRKGSVHTATIPALGDSTISGTVYFTAPLGEYATWRPTHQRGEFDIRSFEVRLRPNQPITGLCAGMTVRFTNEDDQ